MTIQEPSAPIRTPPVLLRRSKDDRVIGGVSGGVGRYLGVDPVVLRIAFVILAFSGAGLLIYLVGWIAIPEEKEGDAVGPAPQAAGMRGRSILGALVIVAGCLLLISQFIPSFDNYLWPIALCGVGVYIMFGVRQ